MKSFTGIFATRREPVIDTAHAADPLERCLACGEDLTASDAYRQMRVCGACRFHYTLDAFTRIEQIADPGTFRERNRGLLPRDPIAFAGSYRGRLSDEERRTGLTDAIVTGTAKLNGAGVVLAVMDFRFLGGTIGSVVGEKIAQAMEAAGRQRRPLIAVIASGGARVQEGPLALLQMAKIASARGRLTEAGAPFLCVLTNPTLGAAYAGIGALADFTIAERGALIGYRAARSLDYGDEQTAEDLVRRGLIDAVVDRGDLRDLVGHVGDLLSARPGAGTGVDAAFLKPKHLHGQAWSQVQIARHQRRPAASDYIERMTSRYIEVRGDGAGSDAAEVSCGIASLGGEAVVLVGQQRRGDDAAGSPWMTPEGFRKAVRAIRLAGRFRLPMIALIDTPGADPRPAASNAGIAAAMAECMTAMADVSVPTIAALIGEGGSEAAAAFGLADRVLMLEHAIYSVVSPERAAMLLHRDASRASEVADALHLTADACLTLGVIDAVVPEPAEGAHADHAAAAENLRAALLHALADLRATPPAKRRRARYRRYRSIGECDSYLGVALAREAGELRSALTRTAERATRRLRRVKRKPAAAGVGLRSGDDPRPA